MTKRLRVVACAVAAGALAAGLAAAVGTALSGGRRAVPDDPVAAGADVGLRAAYDASRFSPNVRVILEALKRHGMVLADNGSDWFVSGAPDPRWDDDELRQLKRLRGSDLEVVRMGRVVTR